MVRSVISGCAGLRCSGNIWAERSGDGLGEKGRSCRRADNQAIGAAEAPNGDKFMSDQSTAKTTIAPMLSVRNGVQALEFYKQAFAAEELFKIENGGGGGGAGGGDGAEFWGGGCVPRQFMFQ